MAYILNVIYLLLFVSLLPVVAYRMLRYGRYRGGWGERFGFSPRRNSDKGCIWIHGVSMGEINAIGTLVSGIKEELPGFEIVITSTTDTGMARAKKLYGDDHLVFYYPYDFTFAVKRAFNRIRPSLCILMELEVWYNFTAVAQRRSIPVVVANGRISSAKGFARYKKIAPLVRPMFGRLALTLAQDDEYAGRFRYLGVPSEKVKVAGSLKYDTAEVTDNVIGAGELAKKLQLHAGYLVWVAGSTGPGEEEIILDSYKELKEDGELKTLRLVLVPRKPERFDEVARLINDRGYRILRYSEVKAGNYKVSGEDKAAVILGDTMGDLRKFYSLASVIFVGRSLTPMGGSDMMEAAALARPVVVGPYTDNFISTIQLLLQGNGIDVVADGRQLTQVTRELLTDKDKAAELGQNGRRVIMEHKGATGRTVEEIAKILKVI